MQKISFEDTTVVKSPYVIIDGVEHEVYNGTYQGGTDLNAQIFNQMQDNIETAINTIELMGGGDEVGTVKMFSGSTAPQGWLICDGSAISRTEYSELFSAIGTTYGSGNGTTTFNIPNIKGRTVVGLDNNDTDFDTLGETLGEKTHTLTINEMPSHNHHIITGYTGSGGEYVYYSQNSGSGSMGTDNAGGNQPHNIIQPSIVLNYIIKASATTTTQGQIIDSLSGDSTTDAPSVHAVNEKFSTINNYSTSERIVGIYKDGKPIYKKTVYISSLPNAQQQGYAHNISNIDTVVDAVAVAHTDNTTAHIPYIGVTSNLNIGMFANLTEITFVVGADRTNWNADVDMYYTKTTD